MPSPTAVRPPAVVVVVGMQAVIGMQAGMSADGRRLPSVSWLPSGLQPPPPLLPRHRHRPLPQLLLPHLWSSSPNPLAAPAAAAPPPPAEPGWVAASADHHPQQPLGELGNLLGAETTHPLVGGL
jgi:hypothetical protein